MKLVKYSILCFMVVFFVSCTSEKKKHAFYDKSVDAETDSLFYNNGISIGNSQMSKSEIISIPFTEQGGVKCINVTVNGVGLEMIFDTGCSHTQISIAEAKYLYQKGKLKQEDLLGHTNAQIADGSIVEAMVVNLKEVVLDGKIIFKDVKATVSSNNDAPLLLGNEILDRVASYVIDNENYIIKFKLK